LYANAGRKVALINDEGMRRFITKLTHPLII
jgi:hypothetical protein